MALNRLNMAYGLMSFCQAILHNLFLVYHVDVFVSVYKISQNAFWLGEAIFLIWNSLNDPLFGWLSDRSSLESKTGQSEGDTVSRRISAIRRYGPVYASSFLLLWFAWPWPGLQFIVCLCLYDGFLTIIDLHHTALLADMAVSLSDRTQLEFASSLFNALGTLSLFASYFVWDRTNLAYFRLVCLSLGVASALGFLFSSHILADVHVQLHIGSSKKMDPNPDDTIQTIPASPSANRKSSWSAIKLYARQVLRHDNFKWFTSMNLLQVFHCHFNSNFFPLFLEHLLGNSVSSFVSASLLSISFVLPHINNLFFLSLCRRYGVYSIVRALFLVKVLLAGAMLLIGPHSFMVLCIFIMSNRVFTEGTCKLLNLVVSDLVDEDFVIHGRREPVAALTFGTSALLCKPGQSLAPVVGMWLLTRMTGRSLFADQMELESDSTASSLAPKLNGHDWSGVAHQYDMQSACFQLLVAVPLVCGILQLLIWTQFSLHGARLANIKRCRTMRDTSSSSSREPV